MHFPMLQVQTGTVGEAMRQDSQRAITVHHNHQSSCHSMDGSALYVCHARSHEMQPADSGTRADDMLLFPPCPTNIGR